MRSGKIKILSRGTAEVLGPIALLVMVMAAGCAPSAPQGNSVSGDPPPILDQAPGPASYKDGITKLFALRDTMRDAFAAKNIDQAHGPLHDVGHLLEALPELFAKVSTAESDRETVRKAVDELFDHFGKVDAKMHGEAGASYEDVSKSIDAALDKLQQLTPR